MHTFLYFHSPMPYFNLRPDFITVLLHDNLTKINSLRVQHSLEILKLQVRVLWKLICKEKQVNQKYSTWSKRRLSPLKLQLSNSHMGVSIDLVTK